MNVIGQIGSTVRNRANCSLACNFVGLSPFSINFPIHLNGNNSTTYL